MNSANRKLDLKRINKIAKETNDSQLKVAVKNRLQNKTITK